jgi:hypothetical protein
MIHRNPAADPAARETSSAAVSLHDIELALGAPDAPDLARDIAALVAAGLIEIELDATGRIRARLSET